MEDRTKVADLTQHTAFASCQRAGFFAVFDGHAGPEVAEHLSDHLVAYFLAEGAARSEPLAALKRAVLRCEADVLKQGLGAGSTALAAVIIEDDLYLANVGDSRAIIHSRVQKKTEQLTTDHKPLEPREHERLTRAGALVSHDGYLCGEPPARAWLRPAAAWARLPACCLASCRAWPLAAARAPAHTSPATAHRRLPPPPPPRRRDRRRARAGLAAPQERPCHPGLRHLRARAAPLAAGGGGRPAHPGHRRPVGRERPPARPPACL
jgi:hypothetical protein